jgi:hypothetical protein
MAALFNAELGTSFKVSHVPDAILWGMSLFSPLLRDVREMAYQYRTDYVMSDAKFRRLFPSFQPTPYTEGIPAMVAYFRH